MTDDDVHSAVVRWIAAKTGVTTIKAYQGADDPPLPYVMVNMTGVDDVRALPSIIEYTQTDEDNTSGEKIIEAAPVMEREWRFSVHAYGTAPTGTLRPILSAIQVSQAIEPLYPSLLAHSASQIRHVPDWINNQWQPRAQMDLFVRGITRDAHVADVIDEYSFDIAPMGS